MPTSLSDKVILDNVNAISFVKLHKPGIDKSSLEEISKSSDFFFRISVTGPEGLRQSVISKVKGNDVGVGWSTYSYDDTRLGVIYNVIKAQEIKNENFDKISKIIETSELWSLGKQEEITGVMSSISGVTIEMSHQGKHKKLYYFQPEYSEKQNDKLFVRETLKILKSLSLNISPYLYNLNLHEEFMELKRKEAAEKKEKSKEGEKK